MTMQTKRKFTARKWLAAMLCLTIALVALNITTWAIDLDALNYLTVTTDEQIDEGAKIVIDIYQLAVANPVEGFDTYGYKFNTGFNTMTIGEETPVSALENGTVSLSQDQWDKMAQDASSLIQEGKVNTELVQQKPSISFGGTATLPAGLYLLIARGAELDDYWDTSEEDNKIITIAESDYNRYSFTPALVSLPTKAAGEGGDIGTAADYGPWLNNATVKYDATVNMKIGIEPRYGSIQITKQIDQFNGTEEVTFVFEVTADGTFGQETYHYSTTASVAFNQATGTSATVTVDHIRAGAKVQVKEVYDGLRYHGVNFNTWQGPETVTADSEGTTPITFTFTNNFTNDHSGGHGIQNHFEFGRLPGETQDHWIPRQQTAGSGLYD